MFIGYFIVNFCSFSHFSVAFFSYSFMGTLHVLLASLLHIEHSLFFIYIYTYIYIVLYICSFYLLKLNYLLCYISFKKCGTAIFIPLFFNGLLLYHYIAFPFLPYNINTFSYTQCQYCIQFLYVDIILAIYACEFVKSKKITFYFL